MYRLRRLGVLAVGILGVLPSLTAAAAPAPVILVSIDTLRADHLGCYARGRIRTPHIDELARGGTLFSRIDSPVPLTLPAHMSLLSASYPFVHGIEENGQQIGPGAVTLATVLKGRGFHTGAFIGGYVLDARFGLNQGFDVYDSPFHLSPHPGEEPADVKRPAETVLNAALEWMKTQSGPFFAFIHLYDVHQPYTHGSYDREVAYVDNALGTFRQRLESRGLLKNSVFVLTSDHGESLGEHGEETHGYFIYQSTLWVPLIVHWPAGGQHAARVDEPASLIDVAPTILDFLGVSLPSGFQGHSLMKPFGEEAIYSESMYARDHLGCSPLRSVRAGGYKYIDAPKPELYDLRKDPAESHNLYDSERPLAAKMRARLLSLVQPARHPASQPPAGDVAARLRTLGYAAGAPARPASNIDPKDRFQLYIRYGRAIRLANSGRIPEAIREFQGVLQEDPQNALARFYLAVCYYRSHRLDEAIETLKATLMMAGNYPAAEELLGTIWLLKEDYTRARQQFEHLASVAPSNYGAHYNLGILALKSGRTEEAIRELQAAARADPSIAQPHSALGSLYKARGDSHRAAEEFQRAIALDPDDQTSRKNLDEIRATGR